jgi:uncharacterized protein
MTFDWDDAKRASNLKKHGIDFIDVLVAFDDPRRYEDVHYVDGEERWRLIGATPDGLVLVIYRERQHVRRLISARRANRHEKELYHYGTAD